MLRLVERSNEPAISLDAMARHLKREDTTEDDEFIAECAAAATEKVENFTGLALVDQTWDYYFDEFPVSGDPWIPTTNWDKSIYLPKPPLIEIIGVFGRDTAEAAFTDYLVESPTHTPARIYLSSTGSWPSTDGAPNAGRIRFRAGYIDTAGSPIEEGDIPAAIKHGIKACAAILYGDRELQSPRAFELVEHLLRAYRVENSMA